MRGSILSLAAILFAAGASWGQTAHTVNPPYALTGPQNLLQNQAGAYSLQAVACSLGHGGTFSFHWGDNTPDSSFDGLPQGHGWYVAGTFVVKAKMKCNGGVESEWSTSLTVTVMEHVVSSPSTPVGPPSVVVGQTASYTTGGSSCKDRPIP